MLHRIPTTVYILVILLIGLSAVSTPALVLSINKHESTSERYVTNSCLLDYKLPSRTLQDIATYADQLSVVSAMSDRYHQLPSGSPGNEAPSTVRLMRVRVDQTLWRRDNAPEMTGEFETTVFSRLSEGQRSISGDTRFEVGKRYLAPLTLFESNREYLGDDGA